MSAVQINITDRGVKMALLDGIVAHETDNIKRLSGEFVEAKNALESIAARLRSAVKSRDDAQEALSQLARVRN